MLISIKVPPQVWETIGGKTKWVYDEQLKRILLMTGKNVTAGELNDNIDDKNVVIIWISLCLQIK